MILTRKQTTAIDFLEDDITNELLFGGAAGGGKSALGCYWQLKRRIKYPGTRGLIGRTSFKTLKETTLQTFFEIAKRQGLKRGVHLDLTGAHDKERPNCIIFPNSSFIYLKDLSLYPQDPEFDELGSLEITDVFVDEANQIVKKARDVLNSRIRFRLDEYGLVPKSLYSCNPAHNWTYEDFYRPSRDKTLHPTRKFIQSLLKDNPHISRHYAENLAKMDAASRARLLDGNWEYLDDPAILIPYDKIIDLWTNNFAADGQKYMTVDVARFGKDTTVIVIWNGWRAKIYQFKGLSVAEVAVKVQALQTEHSVPNSNTIVDEDGVGGGVVDIVKCKGFVNNSRPLPNPEKPEKDEKGNVKPENYDHLKSQCYFRMANRVNKNGIFIESYPPDTKELIVQEFQQVKRWNIDKDGKMRIIPKDKVKEQIGRSPDFTDAIAMREYFELAPQFVFVPREEW